MRRIGIFFLVFLAASLSVANGHENSNEPPGTVRRLLSKRNGDHEYRELRKKSMKKKKDNFVVVVVEFNYHVLIQISKQNCQSAIEYEQRRMSLLHKRRVRDT